MMALATRHTKPFLFCPLLSQEKNATCYPGIQDDLINAGAVYTDEKVVVDQNLVTSRRSEDLPYFTHAFLCLI